MDRLTRARRWLGAVLREWLPYRRALATRDGWLTLSNRHERLEVAPDHSGGIRCCWQWTSDLSAPRLLPQLGIQIMRRALASHPIVQSDGPAIPGASPEVSFIIGHRGESRLPLMLATIRSIAAQQGVRVECIVVEQSDEPLARSRLQSWVRHVHTPPPAPGMPYSRAWSFNIGIRHARAPVVVLHDNDMLAPIDYAASVLRHVREGYEAVNLKRFVFYLDEAHSRAMVEEAPVERPPMAITQNLEAGGSIAITREAYERIGGMDESFIGWGGEDNEFWERAQTLKVWNWAYLPIVHLWHDAQPGKQDPGNPTLAHARRLSAIDPRERIATLRGEPSGQARGPRGWKGAA